MRRSFLLGVLAVAALPTAATAHGMGVEVKRIGATVQVEAYFDDDSPARAAEVTVTGSGGAVVATGTTDDKGVCTFAAPPAGTYKVVVDAGAGHRATKLFTIPGDPPPAERVVVSEGLSREETTGSRRFAMVGLGLVAIAGTSASLWWTQRRNRAGARI